jgi:hypothetical protein
MSQIMIKQRNIEIHEVKFFEFVDNVDHELPITMFISILSFRILRKKNYNNLTYIVHLQILTKK